MTQTSRRAVKVSSLLWTLAAILLLGALIAVLDLGAIARVNTEAGDFAANSLLVEKAKHLSLLTGHYSRFGFYHPGPVLLYVLAAGEWVMFDLLHIVPSRFSGQLVAVAFFDAFWIVALFRIIASWKSGRRLPLIGTLAFILTVTLFDHQFVNGIWFPLLYPLPFAVLVVALAAWCSGWARAVLPTALAAGVLLNGHASFLTIISIVVVLMLVFNTAAYWTQPHRRILGLSYARSHARLLWGATAIIGLLMLPLLIQTVRHFPGPVADYVRFGGVHEPHPLVDSLNFTASFWGGMPGLVAAVIVSLALVLLPTPNPRLARIVRGLVAGVAAATISVIVYSIFGVDSLANTYLGYFAYTLPGILVLAATVFVWARVGDRLPLAVVTIVAITLSAVTIYLHVPQAFPPDYDRPDARDLREALISQQSGAPVVLDLDSTADWMAVWSHVVAVQALERGNGNRLLCVSENWNLAFTTEARCTADKEAGSVRYRVSSPPTSDADVVIGPLSLTRVEPRTK